MNVKRFAAYSFRQKFFLRYFALLVVFLALMFPFVSSSVQKIVLGSMQGRADELVTGLLKAKNQDELIHIIKEQKHYTFFRIALLHSYYILLYCWTN